MREDLMKRKEDYLLGMTGTAGGRAEAYIRRKERKQKNGTGICFLGVGELRSIVRVRLETEISRSSYGGHFEGES